MNGNKRSNRRSGDTGNENDKMETKSLSYNCLSTIADNIKDNEIQQLGKSLGFSDTDIEAIFQSKWASTTFARVYHMLCWWKSIDGTLATKKNLIQALLAINRRKLVEEIFPDFQEYKLEIKFPPISSSTETMTTKDADSFSQDLIKLLASNLVTYDFYRLCQELHLTEREMQNLMRIDWRNNSQERVSQMLNIWFQMTANKDRKTILVQALNSIHRNDLAKEIHQGNVQISTSKENKFVSTEHKEQKFTLENEKGIDQRSPKIDSNKNTTVMSKTVIKDDKGNDQKSPKIDSKNSTTVISKTVIKDDKDYTTVLQPENKEINEASVTSSPEHITGTDPFSEELINLLASKLETDEFHRLCRKLHLKQGQMDNLKKICWPNNSQELVSQMLNMGLQMTSNEDSKTRLVEALKSIKRKDLATEIHRGNIQISTCKKNKFASSKHKNHRLTSEKDKDTEREIISEQMLRNLSGKLRIEERSKLYTKLGLTQKEIKDVIKEHNHKEHSEQVHHVLMKWKRKCVTSPADEILERALLSIKRKDLINEILPELKIFRKLADSLDNSNALFKTLGITNEEMPQEEEKHAGFSYTSQTYNVGLLRRWWRKMNNDGWDCILKDALLSINRQDLIKTLFPEDKSEIKFLPLSSSAETMTTKDTDLMPVKMELGKPIYEDAQTILQHGEKSNGNFRTENIFNETSHPPVTCGSQSPCSSAAESFLQVLIELLASNLYTYEFYHLCQKLHLTEDEMDNLMKISWQTNSQERVFQMLMKAFLKSPSEDRKKIVVKALKSIKRNDLAKKISQSNVQINNFKENKFVSIKHKNERLTSEKQKDLMPVEKKLGKPLKKDVEIILQDGEKSNGKLGTKRKIFAQLFNKIGEYDGLLFVNNLNGVTVADKEKIMKLPGKWQDKYCYLMQMWKEKITSLDWKFELVSALDAIERPDVIKDLFPNYLTKSSGIEGMPFQRKSIQDEINGQTSQYHDEPTLMEKTLRREKYEENIKDEVPVRVILHKEKKEEKCPSKRDSGRERDNLFWISQMGQTVPTLMDRTLNREYEKNTMDEFPGRVDLLEEKKKEKCPSKHESDPEQNNSLWLFQMECSDFREVCEKLSNKQAVDLLKKLGIEHEIIKDEKKLKRMKDGRKLFSNILQNWLFMTERKRMLTDALVSINRLDLVKDLFPSRDLTVATPPAIENINEVVLTSQSQLDPEKVFEKELVSKQMLRKLSCKLPKKESSMIYKKLGLQRQDIENVMKVHSNRPLNERVYHCLMKWKLKAINSNADEVLARALWSIRRKDLINENFPEQKILKLVANQLDKNDAIVLINKMDLKREVMQSITWDTQKKYQILRKWWQKVDDNEWDYILVRALLSINRQELVKDLFPAPIQAIKHGNKT